MGMPGPPFIEGETVTLRTIEEDDVPFLQRTINDPRVRRGLAAFDPKTEADEREWITSVGEDGGVALAICVGEDPVGTVGLDAPNEVWGVAEIGYLLAPEAWGEGYATDAVGLLCEYAFDERRLNEVVAAVYATNPASARVLEKVGFQREGVLRREAFVEGEYVDLYRYGLLAGDR